MPKKVVQMKAMQFLDMLLNDLDNDRKRKVIEFVFLWQDYNYWYNRKNKNNQDLLRDNRVPIDKKQALALANDDSAIRVYNELKDSFLSQFRIIPANNRENWQRDRLLNTGYCQIERQYNEENCSLEDFLTLVYQLRCNFIHGSKNGDDVDIQLIAWARDCLGDLLAAVDYFQD